MVGRVDIGEAVNTNYDGLPKTTIQSESTDGISETGETFWDNDNWNDNWGAFNEMGELKSGFLMKSKWAVGKGWTADNATTVLLNRINITGKENFDDFLFNADLIKNVNGDSYTLVIRNEETGTLINLRPLDPGSMTTVWNSKGVIIRYEQRSKRSLIRKVFGQRAKVAHTFQPEQIFHLMNNRFADQTHGMSDIDAVREVIIADKESFKDVKKLAHFQGMPFIIFKVKNDNPTKIAGIIKVIENARKNGDDLVLPDDDDILSWETVDMTPSSFLLDWRNELKNMFYRRIGLPEVLFGTSGATESGGKMEMFAHETTFEHNQRYIERQLLSQLGIKIDLIPPSTLLNNLQTDEKKDANIQTKVAQPNDLTAGGER